MLSSAWPAVVQTDALKDKVKHAKVLAVGAGGIGCELLKTLVLSGFENIDVVDMDTIETSNLNRQFLFRKRHVGQSKAVVAAEAVHRFRPNATINAHQANIKEARFGLDFFAQFDVVLNGLDNLEARRHVNRLCLAAKVPLVESGTQGYTGQVTVHARTEAAAARPAFHSECFECQPKPVPKTFPVCTIRNTPDKPIHCVVWAKEMLFQRLFGRPEEVTDLDEGSTGSETAEAERELVEAERADPSAFSRGEGEAPAAYARRIFTRIFHSDIVRLLAVEKLWQHRSKPTPLDLAEILKSAPASDGTATANRHHGAASHPSTASQALGLGNDHATWTLLQNTQVFLQSIQLFLETRQSELGAAVFDKDDALAVEFVTAASNLRSHVFGIPLQSMFDTKGMAGNIIHAIATTNAIISGLIVVEALKLLAQQPQRCKATYLNRLPNPKRMLYATVPAPPADDCAVCGRAQLHLSIDTRATPLSAFVTKVLKGRLALMEPMITCGEFMYEEGAGLEEDEIEENRAHLPKALAVLPGGGLGHGSVASVQDNAQSLSVQLVITHQEEWDEQKHPERFTLTGTVPHATSDPGPSADAGTTLTGAIAAVNDEDDVVLVTAPEVSAQRAAARAKRKLDEAADASPAAKKARPGAAAAAGLAVIELD